VAESLLTTRRRLIMSPRPWSSGHESHDRLIGELRWTASSIDCFAVDLVGVNVMIDDYCTCDAIVKSPCTYLNTCPPRDQAAGDRG